MVPITIVIVNGTIMCPWKSSPKLLCVDESSGAGGFKLCPWARSGALLILSQSKQLCFAGEPAKGPNYNSQGSSRLPTLGACHPSKSHAWHSEQRWLAAKTPGSCSKGFHNFLVKRNCQHKEPIALAKVFPAAVVSSLETTDLKNWPPSEPVKAPLMLLYTYNKAFWISCPMINTSGLCVDFRKGQLTAQKSLSMKIMFD